MRFGPEIVFFMITLKIALKFCVDLKNIWAQQCLVLLQMNETKDIPMDIQKRWQQQRYLYNTAQQQRQIRILMPPKS